MRRLRVPGPGCDSRDGPIVKSLNAGPFDVVLRAALRARVCL